MGLGHWAFGLMLALLFLSACERGTEIEQRRTIPRNQTAVNPSGDATSNQNPDDSTLGTVDPDFRPDDPNTFARKAGVAFPVVSFSVEGVPSGGTDRYNYSLPVKADPSISHYAYKLETQSNCDKTGGYTVSEAKNPIVLSLDKMPLGPQVLCVIAFHFPTRQWQDLNKALSYNFEKIVFKRTIDSYYEFIEPGCTANARVNAQLTIEGDKATYAWTRVSVPGCPSPDNTTYMDVMSMISQTETTMEGAWHEGATVAGWFKFTWTNPERTTFKGTWGYGAPGAKPEGAWNSVTN
ncbi:hypothetical protein [Oligoflexus tunisiensis]|uniref:hypothetical protein n=1 Tax=Oligoflexus tunisiensis TaxID=708132 RepID=UPI00114CE4D7|nr:hypothetical protein [Oligoflexus tunisiensis]